MIVNIIMAILAGVFGFMHVSNFIRLKEVKRMLNRTSITELLKRIPGSLYLRDRGPWFSPEFELQIFRVDKVLRIGYVADVNFPIPWENDEMKDCLFVSNDIYTDEDLVREIGEMAEYIKKHYHYLKPL